jgi:hypothetical protein
MPLSGQRFRTHGEDLIVVIATGLFAAGLCFLPPTLFESADFVLCWKPAFHFLADSVRAGALPLWNPYVGLGRPFLADTQNAVCYPPIYLSCLGQQFGTFLLVWLHGALAIMGMRRLGSALGTGRWQSYLMGFSFLASGALIARWVTGQIAYCWALSYVPWLLYHAVRTEEPWQGRRLARYAGCLALQFLCGHPQAFWFTGIGQAVFIIASTLRLPLRAALRELRHRLGQFGVATVWCSGLVAIALLPMLELAHESNRAQTTADFANSYNMTWRDLLSLFSPPWKGLVWENNLLVGGVVVVIGIVGLCRVRERNVRGLLGMLGIGLLLALGNQTPFFGLFYKWLPGYAGFRFQARAALLAVVALICAEGIWLSRPHPRLREVWRKLLGIPVRYALVLVVGLQVFELAQGAWMIKQVVTPMCCVALEVPFEHSVEQALLDTLQKKDMIQPHLPPPRVCVPPPEVPANYGMVYHYANLDAAVSLFLRRPWDYLHGMLAITPPIEKGSLARQVYDRGPFPYGDLSLSVGKPFKQYWLSIMSNPSPRAFAVYAAQRADYATVLDRITSGLDIRECAWIESALAEPLPQTNGLPSRVASIKQFAPNSLVVDVEPRTNALLVVAEAWYPGWRAEIDGHPGACVPANVWMRAVPVPPGRHEVRLYFRQDYLLPGFLISVVTLGLLVAIVVKRRCSAPSPLGAPEAARVAAQPKTGGKRPTQRRSPLARVQSSPSGYHPLLRVLAFGGILTAAGLLTLAEIRHVRWFLGQKAGVDANVEYRIGVALSKKPEPGPAKPHFLEALRLVEEACRLTEYRDPLHFTLLVFAYDAAGFSDKAIETATTGRDLAREMGQHALADQFQGLLDQIAARTGRAAERK